MAPGLSGFNTSLMDFIDGLEEEVDNIGRNITRISPSKRGIELGAVLASCVIFRVGMEL